MSNRVCTVDWSASLVVYIYILKPQLMKGYLHTCAHAQTHTNTHRHTHTQRERLVLSVEQCVSVLLDCSARGLSVFLCGETHSDVSLLVCSWGTLTRAHSQTRPITTFLWFVWISSLFDDYDYKHASLWNAPWMSTFLPLDTVEAIVSSFPSPGFSLCSRKYLCY
jgi:hypothetical protein